MKPRVLYEETYRKGEANIRKDLLPDRLPYFADGTTLVSMELHKAGRVEIDGEELEFQLIYVLCKPGGSHEEAGLHEQGVAGFADPLGGSPHTAPRARYGSRAARRRQASLRMDRGDGGMVARNA